MSQQIAFRNLYLPDWIIGTTCQRKVGESIVEMGIVRKASQFDKNLEIIFEKDGVRYRHVVEFDKSYRLVDALSHFGHIYYDQWLISIGHTCQRKVGESIVEMGIVRKVELSSNHHDPDIHITFEKDGVLYMHEMEFDRSYRLIA